MIPPTNNNQMSDQQILDERAIAEQKETLKNLEPIDFETLDEIVRKWILIADTGIIKLLAALVISNRLDGHDPVWTMLIGPSGGGKTEILNMLMDLEDIYPISLLTPNTFLSGMYVPRTHLYYHN